MEPATAQSAELKTKQTNKKQKVTYPPLPHPLPKSNTLHRDLT